MMRLMPRTLFARMVLVLVGGLIAAQFLSLAVHWRERGEFVMRTAGMYSAERVAEIIKLLDVTPAAERARIVGVLNSPPLRVTLAAADSAVESDPEMLDEAVQWGANLIVLGTHGRRGMRRLMLGSDAEQIVRGAAVPVLLVRAPDAAA